MSLLEVNSLPAERARGLTFAEQFQSPQDVVENEGVISGNPTFIRGIGKFDGTDDKVTYPKVSAVKSISFWIKLTTTTEDIAQLSSSHSIEAVNGTLTATGLTTPTFYVDGVATATIGTDKVFVTITTDTAFDVDSFDLGADDSFGDFQIEGLKLWNVVLTAQEALDYANNATFNYMNEAKLVLDYKADSHDPTNVRTLDKSISGFNGTLGDGSTPSTYPTKLPKRGYSFDGGDYINIGEDRFDGSDELTIASLFKLTDFSTDSDILNAWDDGSPAIYLLFSQLISGPFWRFIVRDSDDNPISIGSLAETPTILNELTFVAGTYKRNDAINLFVNSGDIAATDATNDFSIQTGGNNDVFIGKDRPFVGEMYTTLVWEKALTPLQIWDLKINLLESINQV